MYEEIGLIIKDIFSGGSRIFGRGGGAPVWIRGGASLDTGVPGQTALPSVDGNEKKMA